MVDELDRKILRVLEEDGRASFTDIAKRLSLHESTIRKRVLALLKKQVIRKFSVVLDPSKIGLNSVAIVGINVEPVKIIEVAQKLCDIPEIKYVATSTGDHMIMTEIWAEHGRGLTKLISEKIGTIEGVKELCPSIILEKLKY